MSKIVSSFVQKAKSGLNLAKGWLFTCTSVIQDTGVIVGLKVLITGKNLTTVLCAQGKENKSGSKLVRIKPDVETNTRKLLSRKANEQWDINIVYL